MLQFVCVYMKSVLNDTVFAFMLVFIFVLSDMVWCYCDILIVRWFCNVFLGGLRKLNIDHNQLANDPVNI